MKIVAYTTILFAASFVNALPVAQQQQQPQQQQQNQQQQQCTMDMLKGYMITSPVNFVAEPQQILPERGQFVDPTNTTILLSNPQGQGNQQGGNQTVPVKFNNQTEVSTEILQNSVYAISWMKTSESGQGGQGQQSQSGQGGQGQQQPQSGQGVQAQQAQQGGQGQGGQGQRSQQQMISPIRVQLVSQNGTLLNVTEALGVLSTGGQKQQQQSGQQQGNQTSQMQAAQQQQGNQNQPQSGQQQGNQTSQQQPASGQRKPGQEGAVVVHLGPEIQPGIYSFLLSAQVQPQQQGGQQQQQQQQQQGPLCQIMTMPFRIRAASDLQQSGSSGNSTSST